MIKLLICLITSALIAVCMLQLRQQNMQLGHQCNQLHNKIRGRQSKLWSQQLEIAQYTAPNAITQTVASQNLNLVPQTPPPAGKRHWIDVESDPAAE